MKPLKDLFLEAIEKHITIYKGSDEQAAAEACEAILKEKMGEFFESTFPKIRGKMPTKKGEPQTYMTWEIGEKSLPELIDLFLKENK